ncbi:MAG: YgjV family protein [Roseateles asaccharophilus]|uniref:YgjV family protein n=1 Tax=Roseateles asaccharophilus TaxID=582607 RepID=UPI00391BCDE5
MPTITDLLSPAQLAGYAAFLLGLLCFAQTDDRRFKLFMALECLAYTLHFAMLDHPSAAASSLISLARSMAAIRWRRPAVGVFFIALSLGMGYALYSGWLSMLPILASCIGTFSLFFLHGLAMRMLMLLGTTLWLVNNVCVGSVGGVLLEACLLSTNLWTISRLWRRQRRSS